MKLLNKIGLIAMLIFAMSACVENTPDYGNFPTKDVDFTYNVSGDQYTLDFYVVSTIQFNNTSSKQGAVSWDFGDGNTSTEANPLHKYAKAGTYNVKLKVDGVGEKTYPLLISDITPVLSVTKQSSEEILINDVTVDLGITLPNPENLKTKYEWVFPDGTTLADGTPITTFEGYSHDDGTIDNPGAVRFKNIGSQKIELRTWFDVNGENRRLDDSYVNVQVGSSIQAPTVYFAVLGGNIKAYKIIDPSQLPSGTKNLPFDMGVGSGNMPTQLVFKTVKTTAEDGTANESDLIYILDCGKQYTYVNDVETRNQGDGKITVMSADGTYSNIVITNVGGCAFNDPFQGCADDTYLYYTDRNTGVCQTELSTRGAKEESFYNAETGSYIVTNQKLGYYGRGIAYGAIHTSLVRDSKGMFYWAKNYSGNGIYRFQKSDIGQTGSIPHPILLSGCNPRAFNIDETRNTMYVWMSKGTPGAGFVEYPLPTYDGTMETKSYTKYIAMDADPMNTTTDEGVFVTQFAIDPITGNVFFGFRANPAGSTYTSGLYYYDYAKKAMVNFNGNKDKILGVCVNPRLTRLF